MKKNILILFLLIFTNIVHAKTLSSDNMQSDYWTTSYVTGDFTGDIKVSVFCQSDIPRRTPATIHWRIRGYQWMDGTECSPNSVTTSITISRMNMTSTFDVDTYLDGNFEGNSYHQRVYVNDIQLNTHNLSIPDAHTCQVDVPNAIDLSGMPGDTPAPVLLNTNAVDSGIIAITAQNNFENGRSWLSGENGKAFYYTLSSSSGQWVGEQFISSANNDITLVPETIPKDQLAGQYTGQMTFVLNCN